MSNIITGQEFHLPVLSRKEKTPWDKEPTKNTYGYPLSAQASLPEPSPSSKNLRRLGPFLVTADPRLSRGPFNNAIDFLIPNGTEVLAAAGGKVFEVHEASEENPVSHITILHANREYSQYTNIKPGSEIKIGTIVQRGQPIATVANPNQTKQPFLRFAVFRQDFDLEKNPAGFKSLKPEFEK